jgi:hypothetical protein
MSPKFTWSDSVYGDFNGDGRDDLAARVKGAANASQVGNWFVSLANAAGTLTAPQGWGKWENRDWVDVLPADYNGDGKDDIVGRDSRTGMWQIAASNGAKLTTRKLGTWVKDAVADWQDVKIADLDGDSKDDIIGRNFIGQWFWIHQSATRTDVFSNRIGIFPASGLYVSTFVADLHHDGRDEISSFEGSTGRWSAARVDPDTGRLEFIPIVSGRALWDARIDWDFAGLGDDYVP